jgi:hypothetical protein
MSSQLPELDKRRGFKEQKQANPETDFQQMA